VTQHNTDPHTTPKPQQAAWTTLDYTIACSVIRRGFAMLMGDCGALQGIGDQ
jgi:hypothetical protein